MSKQKATKGKTKNLRNNKKLIYIVTAVAVLALLLSSLLAYFVSGSSPPKDKDSIEDYVQKLEDQVKEYERSLEAAEDNVKLLTQTADAHYLLGFYYSLLSEPEKALSSYKKAVDYYGQVLEKEPDNVEIHFLRAVSAYSLEDDKLAEDELKRALELDPEHARSHYYYGVLLYYSANDPEGAIAHWQKVVDLNPDGEETLVEQAKKLIKMAEEEMSKEDVENDGQEDEPEAEENTTGDEE